MDFKGNTIKRKNGDKPLCKYGLSCFRKNPEHRKKFKHPTENDTEINSSEVNSPNESTPRKDIEQKKRKKKVRVVKEVETPQASAVEEIFLDETDESSTSVSVVKEVEIPQAPAVEETHLDEIDEPSTSVNVDHSVEETVDEILKSMPRDFFDFWKFCKSVNKSKPEDAFSNYGYHLVGIFDLLAKKLPKDMKVDISCHWRYYFDPPELQTVIKKDGDEWYHIGYFRDDPSKKPFVLASNSAAKDSKLTLVGDNIFCAMNAELNEVIRSLDSNDSKSRATKLQKDLMKLAAEKKYELKIKTEKTEKRRKKVVAKTFNGFGIVVPVKNNIGYRPLPDSNTTLKSILKKIVSAENETEQLKEQEALDEIISNVHFANDELDYGMGLELGIDLFCDGDPYFHRDILGILPLAYDLLNRSKYAAVVRAHLKNRRKGDSLSTLNS